MTEVGVWLIGFALIYTFILIGVGTISRKRAHKTGYFVGGRTFNKWMVAFCITGLFSGSTFISVLELSYLTGISAVWYGVAETIQVLIIAYLIIGPFRKKLVVTVSGMIGEKYGRKALGIGGAITAFAFPMWSVATSIGFASAIHVFTGISLTASIAFTAFLLYFYLRAGGMWSIATTQTLNIFVFILMFGVGIYAVLLNPGLDGLTAFAVEKPAMFSLNAVGNQVIVAWMGTFLVNVILAQAAFQMALSCKTPEEGQKGLKLAALFGVPFILLAIVFGVAAAIVVPGYSQGLVALPHYLTEVLPAPLVGLFFLGVWACALSWGAPCQFSGATSLGKDVGAALNPEATEVQLVSYTKKALLLLTFLMIAFGVLRTEQSAWWNILAWTLRNSSTFAPVVAVLFWKPATRNSVVYSMVAGFSAGLGWYALSGWSVSEFHLNIHPVWVGMSANLITIMAITFIQKGNQMIAVPRAVLTRSGYGILAGFLTLLMLLAIRFQEIYVNGLLGLSLFLLLVTVWIGVMKVFPDIRSTATVVSETCREALGERAVSGT